MSSKSDKYSFIEQSFTASENRYYNLNLNQSKKCPILVPVQFCSKSNNDKYCGKKIDAAVQKKSFAVSKPSPLTFISKLKAYHGKVLADIVQLRIGKNPRQKQRKEWKENDANKRNIVLKYHNQRDKFQFIKDIAATLA